MAIMKKFKKIVKIVIVQIALKLSV